MPDIIPLIDAPRQSLIVRLDEKDCLLKVWWQPSDSSWWAGLEVPIGTSLVRSRRLAVNAGVLDRIEGALPGNIKCRALGPHGEPGRDAWAVPTHELRWEEIIPQPIVRETPDPGVGSLDTPGVVGNVLAAASHRSILLSWIPATKAASYIVQWRASTEGWSAEREERVDITSHLITGLVNGTAYAYRIRARNGYLSGSWTADASATPVAVAPGATGNVIGAVGNSQVSLNWADVLNAASYQVQWKSGSQAYDTARQGAVVESEAVVASLLNGTSYDFRVRAVNSGGGGPWSTSVSYTPLGVPVAPGLPTLVAGNQQIVASWAAVPTATSYRLEYKLAAASWANAMVITGITVISHTLTGLLNGSTYNVRLIAVNAGGAGPTGASATVMLPVLSAPSWTDDTGDAQTWNANSAITAITVPAATALPTPVYTADLPSGLSFDPATRRISGTPAATGSGTIVITATNNQGTGTWSVDYTIGAALAGPSWLDDTGDAAAYTRNAAITAYVVPVATGNPTPVYTASGLAAGLSFDPATRRISGTPTTVGAGTITITATNSGGTDTWTQTWSVAEAPAAPMWTDDTGNAVSFGQNQAITNYAVPAVDIGYPAPTYAATGLPTGLSFNPATRQISGTPTVVGSGTITITATNASGTDTWTQGWSITAGVAAPSWLDDTGDAATFTRGVALTPYFVPAATGNPTPSYSASGIPTGMSFNPVTRRIAGTPFAIGSGTITVTASNSQGADTWTQTYTILEAPTAPLWTDDTGDAVSFGQNEAITAYTVPAVNTGHPAPVYSATGLPAGLSFNAATRQISGTPSMAGTGTITITATNASGANTWTQAWTITAAALSLASWVQPANTENIVHALVLARVSGSDFVSVAMNPTDLLDGEFVVGPDLTLDMLERHGDNQTQLIRLRRTGTANFNAYWNEGGGGDPTDPVYTAADLKLYIQTSAAVFAFSHDSSGGSFSNWSADAEAAVAAIIAIATGDRLIVNILRSTA